MDRSRKILSRSTFVAALFAGIALSNGGTPGPDNAYMVGEAARNSVISKRGPASIDPESLELEMDSRESEIRPLLKIVNDSQKTLSDKCTRADAMNCILAGVATAQAVDLERALTDAKYDGEEIASFIPAVSAYFKNHSAKKIKK